MKKIFFNIIKRSYSDLGKSKPQICIVGGGPAGFYAAQHLSKHLQNAQIDILERLPVPFGLVRFGVAPDHPEVKNVINTFTKTAQQNNVRFVGNVNLGTNIRIKDLKSAYHVVLLTYGAERDRKLHITGEDLPNVFSARSIVGWYNGIPWDSTLKIDLQNHNSVAIFGQGNVAVDVARILLTPVDLLRTTDITEHALQTLSQSKVKEVHLIGRRGPLQAAFTIKELREMLKLPKCCTKWSDADFDGVEKTIPNLQRPRKRLTELMLKFVKESDSKEGRYFLPKFYRSPLEIIGGDKVERVVLGVNRLKEDKAILTDKTEEIECDIVVRSIGYKSQQVDKEIPFDETKGIVKNSNGRVNDNTFVAGWLGTGPTGVILTTMNNAFEVANTVCQSINKGDLKKSKPGFEALNDILQKQNVQTISWKGWEKIDAYEQEQGKKLGKPREKILDVKKMLEIAA